MTSESAGSVVEEALDAQEPSPIEFFAFLPLGDVGLRCYPLCRFVGYTTSCTSSCEEAVQVFSSRQSSVHTS